MIGMNVIIILPLLIPILNAILLLSFWRYRKVHRFLNVIGSFLLMIAGFILLYYVSSNGIIAVQIGSWEAPFGISLVADLFSAIMVAITGIIAFAVAIYSTVSIDSQREKYGFYPLLNIMLMGICGSFLTGDIFNLFVWFEVMLISSFVLLALGGERNQLEGSIKYVTLNLLSSVIFLTAVGMLYGIAGTLNMADLALKFSNLENSGLVTVIAMLFLVSFGIKSALFPLFFWLPASYHTPPVAVSAIFAGLLTKVGVYALIRVFTLMFIQNIDYTHTIILVIAGLTMLIGVLGAAAQKEFRKILSFHIISQIGYMILGLALFTPLAIAGSVFYIVHHIIVKTNLFLVSGVVKKLKKSYDLNKLGGVYKAYPLLSFLFLIPAFSLAGIPPLSGFWAKLTLILAGLEVNEFLIVGVALFVGLLTLFSMSKIWNEVFWKKEPSEESDEVHQKLFGYQNKFLIIPIIFLASLTVLIGLYAEPLFNLSMRTALQLLNPDEYIRAVLGGPNL
jgi:multicomponent Na+:H+ antiporter subunit D